MFTVVQVRGFTGIPTYRYISQYIPTHTRSSPSPGRLQMLRMVASPQQVSVRRDLGPHLDSASKPGQASGETLRNGIQLKVKF